MSKSIQQLKDIRKILGFTQEEMARAMSISRRTYQSYERNQIAEKKIDKVISKAKSCLFMDKEHGILTLRQIKKTINNVLCNHPEVECAYLFGSYCRNEANEKSDVDILIYAPTLKGFRFMALISEFEEALHKRVDMVSLSSISGNEKFLSEILTKGVKLCPSTCSKSGLSKSLK